MNLASPLEEALCTPVGQPHERAQRLLAVVEERPGGGGAKGALERVVGRLGNEDDVRLVEVAAEPCRPPFQVATWTPTRQLLEEVLDQVLLGELLDDLHLLDPDGDLARDRTAELDAGAALGNEQPDELAVRDEGHRKPAAPTAARELRPQLGEPERLARSPRFRVARPALELLARRLEQVDVAGTGGEQWSRAFDDGLQELFERVRAGDRLGELGELLELRDSQPRVLVKSCVLDRACDERGGGHEEVDLVVRELPGRRGVGGDGADRLARAPDDGKREQRLELLLLELGNVLRPRVVERVLANERGLAVLGRPPREALSTLERDLARLALVRRGRGAQLEPLAVVGDEIREARMDAACLGHEADHRAQHLGELERRRDRRDDLVKCLLACPQRHLQADRKPAVRESSCRARRPDRPGASAKRDRARVALYAPVSRISAI